MYYLIAQNPSRQTTDTVRRFTRRAMSIFGCDSLSFCPNNFRSIIQLLDKQRGIR